MPNKGTEEKLSASYGQAVVIRRSTRSSGISSGEKGCASMSDQAEPEEGSIPPNFSARMKPETAIRSLEYAVRALSENAAFAREMATRARSDSDTATAAEFEAEAAEAEGHAANLQKLAGSLRLLRQVTGRDKSRAA